MGCGYFTENVIDPFPCVLNVTTVVHEKLIAASERSERAATLIWPSRTGHLYIAVPYSTFPGSRYFLL